MKLGLFGVVGRCVCSVGHGSVWLRTCRKLLLPEFGSFSLIGSLPLQRHLQFFLKEEAFALINVCLCHGVPAGMSPSRMFLAKVTCGWLSLLPLWLLRGPLLWLCLSSFLRFPLALPFLFAFLGSLLLTHCEFLLVALALSLVVTTSLQLGKPDLLLGLLGLFGLIFRLLELLIQTAFLLFVLFHFASSLTISSSRDVRSGSAV